MNTRLQLRTQKRSAEAVASSASTMTAASGVPSVVRNVAGLTATDRQLTAGGSSIDALQPAAGHQTILSVLVTIAAERSRLKRARAAGSGARIFSTAAAAVRYYREEHSDTFIGAQAITSPEKTPHTATHVCVRGNSPPDTLAERHRLHP